VKNHSFDFFNGITVKGIVVFKVTPPVKEQDAGNRFCCLLSVVACCPLFILFVISCTLDPGKPAEYLSGAASANTGEDSFRRVQYAGRDIGCGCFRTPSRQSSLPPEINMKRQGSL
jgi:hypothetical protein